MEYVYMRKPLQLALIGAALLWAHNIIKVCGVEG